MKLTDQGKQTGSSKIIIKIYMYTVPFRGIGWFFCRLYSVHVRFLNRARDSWYLIIRFTNKATTMAAYQLKQPSYSNKLIEAVEQKRGLFICRIYVDL